jgi:signal transduction histidine kinase
MNCPLDSQKFGQVVESVLKFGDVARKILAAVAPNTRSVNDDKNSPQNASTADPSLDQDCEGSQHLFNRDVAVFGSIRPATSQNGTVIDTLEKLADLVDEQRESLLSRWRTQVRELDSARHLDTPTLTDHIPRFLTELASAFRGHENSEIADQLAQGCSSVHGMQRVRDAYDIDEVVAEYNILRSCLHDLADENGLQLQGRPFKILNRMLDGAIGAAVRTFAAQKVLETQLRHEEHVAFVAHDLRTPLNAISLAARVLETVYAESPADRSQTTPMWKALKRNVTNLEQLIRKVVEENTNQEADDGAALQRRSFDLWPVVESIILDMVPVADSSRTRLFNRVPDEFHVFADAGLLRRVFQNLIANAIAYTPNGEVEISAEMLDDLGTAACWVKDNGEGISPERCDSVFERYVTDADREGGMGLGLSIVKTFVEAHGGELSLQSELNKGSTFRFTLPAQRHRDG